MQKLNILTRSLRKKPTDTERLTHPVKGEEIKNPRKNWKQYFKKMKENKEDQLIIDDKIGLNTENWEW